MQLALRTMVSETIAYLRVWEEIRQMYHWGEEKRLLGKLAFVSMFRAKRRVGNVSCFYPCLLHRNAKDIKEEGG